MSPSITPLNDGGEHSERDASLKFFMLFYSGEERVFLCEDSSKNQIVHSVKTPLHARTKLFTCPQNLQFAFFELPIYCTKYCDNSRARHFLSVYGKYVKSMSARTYVFTGNVQRVIKWYKMIKDACCYFEVIAFVVSMREGSVNGQKILLLQDQKGPILQLMYFVYQVTQLEDIRIGSMLRCVGYMSGPNLMTAINIRSAIPEEVSTLKRYCCIGDFTMSGLMKDAEFNV